MENIMVRKANYSDIEKIDAIYTDAKAFLKRQGLNQWQDESGYPNYIDAKIDIDNDSLFVCEMSREIVGVCCYTSEINEDYDEIYDGHWQSDGIYLTIHRIATKESTRGLGIGNYLLEYAEKYAKSLGINQIRIDTHELNKPMRSLAMKMGYREAGIIYIKRTDNDPKRIAYDKLV